ncbi:hypothetical protein [Streptomyces sp. NPDC055109]
MRSVHLLCRASPATLRERADTASRGRKIAEADDPSSAPPAARSRLLQAPDDKRWRAHSGVARDLGEVGGAGAIIAKTRLCGAVERDHGRDLVLVEVRVQVVKLVPQQQVTISTLSLRLTPQCGED